MRYVDLFPDMIKKERTSRKLTQAKMAELLDTTVRHYQDLERGRKKPGCEVLYRLAHKVGVNPAVILSLPPDVDKTHYYEICHLLKLCNDDNLSVILATLRALLNFSHEKDTKEVKGDHISDAPN